MAELVNIITWPNVNVEPVDDALVYETAIGAGGIIYGCTATLRNSNTLHVSAGHAIICGRKLTIVEGDITVELSTSGTLKGRLYLQLDLSNTTEPARLLTEVGTSITPPVQDQDVNIINGTYEIDLYYFDVSTSEVLNQEKVFSPITGGLQLAQKQFLHAFAASSFALVSGGTWGGYYRSGPKNVVVHNQSGSVRASGQTLDAPPSDAVKGAVSNMYFEIDDAVNTLTAYTKSAPSETIYVSVEGVE